jgi:hypothetical protein
VVVVVVGGRGAASAELLQRGMRDKNTTSKESFLHRPFTTGDVYFMGYFFFSSYFSSPAAAYYLAYLAASSSS